MDLADKAVYAVCNCFVDFFFSGRTWMFLPVMKHFSVIIIIAYLFHEIRPC